MNVAPIQTQSPIKLETAPLEKQSSTPFFLFCKSQEEDKKMKENFLHFISHEMRRHAKKMLEELKKMREEQR